jgi:hypothetical protein
MSLSSRFLFPILGLFLIITLVIWAFSAFLQRNGIHTGVLLVANGIFLLLNIIVFLIQKKAIAHPNPNVFIRSVMGGMMLKMLVCAVAVLAYVLSVGPGYNKRSVFISLFIYLIYLAVEVTILMRLNNKKHA